MNASEQEREFMEWRERELNRLSLVAAILAAGRCSPTGATMVDADALMRDALAIVEAARVVVPIPK
jgi:hypothetical protein